MKNDYLIACESTDRLDFAMLGDSGVISFFLGLARGEGEVALGDQLLRWSMAFTFSFCRSGIFGDSGRGGARYFLGELWLELTTEETTELPENLVTSFDN